jgi:hypothetical protein
MSQLADILRKAKQRGIPWIRSRTIQELTVPSTRAGTALARLSRPVAGAVSRLRGALERATDGGADPNALVLAYDLALAPITFDFAWTLVDAEMERRRRDLRRLDVVFVPGTENGLRPEDGEYESNVDWHARRWRLDNILVAMCRFVPSIGSVVVAADRGSAAKILRTYGNTVWPRGYNTAIPNPPGRSIEALALAESGVDIRVLDAGTQARRYARGWLDTHCPAKRTLVITLRDYGYMPARNSNFEAWGGLAKSLPGNWQAIFVPDTDRAFGTPTPLEGGLFCREAAWNLAFRLGLYEEADLNMAVSCGPMNMCWFDPRVKYAMVRPVTPGVPQASPELLEKFGHKIGIDPPFVREGQSWVWENDDPPVLLRVFDDAT